MSLKLISVILLINVTIFIISVSLIMGNKVSSLPDKAPKGTGVSYEDFSIPLILNTWDLKDGNLAAWAELKSGRSALDAVEKGCSVCEELIVESDYTVGYGGSPDEKGETTLDAIVFDGKTHDAGAVGCLRNIRNATSVARSIMDHTKHTVLVGELASNFAKEMGFKPMSLETNRSLNDWKTWLSKNCQPNYRQNVSPDPTKHCGPYKPLNPGQPELNLQKPPSRYNPDVGPNNHDTVGLIAIDNNGDIAAGASSNGAIHKVPGRVGDVVIPGAGVYVDNDVGAAAETGDGDVMMRFLPTYRAVNSLRAGMSPTEAATDAIQAISRFYPDFSGAIIVADKKGNFGAACHGFSYFKYIAHSPATKGARLFSMTCTTGSESGRYNLSPGRLHVHVQ